MSYDASILCSRFGMQYCMLVDSRQQILDAWSYIVDSIDSSVGRCTCLVCDRMEQVATISLILETLQYIVYDRSQLVDSGMS